MDPDENRPAGADVAESPPDGEDFAGVLRAAIAASGRSLEEVRRRLADHGVQVSIASLSYWQSGRSRPERATSLSAMGPLEEVLGVPRGTLVGRLRFAATARRPSRRRGPMPLGGGSWPAAEEAFARLGVDADALVRRSVHDRIELGPAGERRRHRVRFVLTAAHDRVDSYPVWVQYEEGHDGAGVGAVPEVVGLLNARVGRTVPLPEYRGLAAQMLLPVPLARGQSIVVEHELRLDDGTPWTGFARHVPATLREAVIEVRFHPDRLPAHAEQVFEPGDSAPPATAVSSAPAGGLPPLAGDEGSAGDPAGDAGDVNDVNDRDDEGDVNDAGRDAADADGDSGAAPGEVVTPMAPTTPLTLVVTDAAAGFHGVRWSW